MKQFLRYVVVNMLLLCVSATLVWSQTGTISGKITAKSNGQPLSGASVNVKGTRIGAVSQKGGAFKLSDVPVGKEQTISVKYVGYKAMERKISVQAGDQTLDIAMEDAAFDLEDIVVTGLAVDNKQKEMGTSRSTVNKAIEEVPGITAEDVLIGRVAGVETYSADGAPGGGVRFRIRGGNSILSASEPLVIIDGVFMDNSNRNTNTGTNTGSASFGASNGTRALTAINPEDIESMEILKGAAAASLYGSRASSGVIVITTKKGGGGSLSVDYNLDAGITQVHRGVTTQKTAWTNDEMRTWRDSINARLTVAQRPLAYTDAELSQWNTNGATNDWLMSPFQQGSFMRHTITLRGGTKDFGYYGSFGQQNTLGHQKGTEFNSTGLHVGFNTSAIENLEIRANVDLSFDTRRMLPGGSPGFFVPNNWGMSSLGMPFMRLEDVRNPFLGAARTTLGIPSSEAYATLRRENASTRIVSTVNLRYKILENLSIDLNTGIDETRTDGKMIYPFGLVNLFPTGRLDVDYEKITQRTLTATLNHQWTISDDLYLKSAAGMQYDDNRRDYDYIRLQGRSLLAPEDKISSYPATLFGQLASVQVVRTLGFYINETIGFQDRLFIQLGGRVDRGTSFKEEFFFYPRANARFIIGEGISARAAFGQSGTQPPPYLVNPVFRLDNLGYDGSVGGIIPTVPGNPNLRPEVLTEIEAGVDGTFLDGRISVELTYYNKQFNDLLLSVPINPAINNGFSRDIRNSGAMTNSGFEFSISADIVKAEGLRWNLGVNGATLTNTVTKLFLPVVAGQTAEITGSGVINAPIAVGRIREGYPLGGFWGYTPESPTAAVYLGTPWAPLDMNLTTQLDIGGFFLRALIGGKFGGKRLNSTSRDLANPTVRMHKDYWNLPAGTATDAAGTSTLFALFNNTSHWVQDASFLKIRQVSIGYTLPYEWLQGSFVRKATLSLTGSNLLTFTAYQGGYDVEAETSGFGAFNGWVRGQDAWEAGIPRSYALSLTLGF
ncbi:MAG: SusC/RagA family TonB-linked outer membrane protein [Candidatus Kapabacteria bacterium]|nr:SusC/RagA family TonB-linked outer membrane protein [Candidatus Kapabacteria bacterium]